MPLQEAPLTSSFGGFGLKEMSDKFCVNLTCAKDDTDKSTVAFVIANAALGSEKDTVVFSEH